MAGSAIGLTAVLRDPALSRIGDTLIAELCFLTNRLEHRLRVVGKNIGCHNMSDVIHVFVVPPAPCTCLATRQLHSIYRLRACTTQYNGSIPECRAANFVTVVSPHSV